MKRIFKRAFLPVFLTLLIPAQSFGFSHRFTQAFATSFAWAKSSCGYVLAGLGLLASAAHVVDIAENKNELAMLHDLMNQLESQRKNKKLSCLATKHTSCARLNHLLGEYNESIKKQDISADLVFDAYEDYLVGKQKEFLLKRFNNLNDARAALFDDPRCNESIGTEDGQRILIKEKLNDYLPVLFLHSDMNAQQAQDEILKLGRQITDCKTHIQGLTYKNNKLDKLVNIYLVRVQEYIAAVKKNISDRERSEAAIEKHGFQDNNKHKEVVVHYDELRKQIEVLIQKYKEKRAKYVARSWKALGLAAFVAGSYALLNLACKGN